jgi:hypothetical protein
MPVEASPDTSVPLGLPHPVGQAVTRVAAGHPSVVLYGSVARGDARPDSDIDVAMIDDFPVEQQQLGLVSLTTYQEEHLTELARSGSLFVLHLKNEGRIIKDVRGAFQRVFAAWAQPDFERTIAGMRAAAAALDVPPPVAHARGGDLAATALFLTRSAVYLRCLQRDMPTFAAADVARVLRDDDLGNFLEDARSARLSADQILGHSRVFLDRYLEGVPPNRFGSLEALAVSCYRTFPMASSIALRLATGERPVRYASAPARWWV